jgi:hypothetical protein
MGMDSIKPKVEIYRVGSFWIAQGFRDGVKNLGTPCLYYGTEQGFHGAGESDWSVRESMFSLEDTTLNALNKANKIYQEIANWRQLEKTAPSLNLVVCICEIFLMMEKSFNSQFMTIAC